MAPVVTLFVDPRRLRAGRRNAAALTLLSAVLCGAVCCATALNLVVVIDTGDLWSVALIPVALAALLANAWLGYGHYRTWQDKWVLGDHVWVRFTPGWVAYGTRDGMWSAPWSAVRRLSRHGQHRDANLHLRVEVAGWGGPLTLTGTAGGLVAPVADDQQMESIAACARAGTDGRLELFPPAIDRDHRHVEPADTTTATCSTDGCRPGQPACDEPATAAATRQSRRSEGSP